MTINELLPILILLFAVFILVYTLTTRILKIFEYKLKLRATRLRATRLRATSEIMKTMIEKGHSYNINDIQKALKKEDRNAIERK